MRKKDKGVNTGKWKVGCWTCKMSAVKSSKLSAEKFRDVHNGVLHQGRTVAYVEELIV